MNNRQKMYETNGKARAYLKIQGYENLYFFPHLRFSKDYNLSTLKFDAMGFKNKRIHFIQIKTNDKPTKKILEESRKAEEEFGCRIIWLNCVKGRIFEYGCWR